MSDQSFTVTTRLSLRQHARIPTSRFCSVCVPPNTYGSDCDMTMPNFYQSSIEFSQMLLKPK
jgi:hypothetical protein